MLKRCKKYTYLFPVNRKHLESGGHKAMGLKLD
ncbi:hypothetical protein HPL003_20325 [Paenibacillus terrae HPL-003]|uniref:Uncharacterized protein n=1 Tax=Paenibacillus terrae (strain HPL-003) TaxID=985665 RepID=G7VRZ6_PAETH|nr:hypothetical protein HPL003_20325 [Paenibacillus terrae HPL-003]